MSKDVGFKTFLNYMSKYLDDSEMADILGVTIDTIGYWRVGRIEPVPPILNGIRDYFKEALEELENLKYNPLSVLDDDKRFKNYLAERLHKKLLFDATLDVFKKSISRDL